MDAIRITAAFVFIAFLAGAFHGAADKERKIAARCRAGEPVRIDSILIRCATRPTWRDR